ncbi:hypothetical protein HDU79_011865 [Rhizoclosmatium sp. JEL0117]|nr:hypothetical protein HDU79_011865 [Rhizoclosmatium sp. JEL0117]
MDLILIYQRYFPAIMAGISSLVFAAALYFILVQELGRSKLSWSVNLKTPFNRSLLLGTFASIFVNIFNEILFNIDLSDIVTWVLYTLRVTFVSTGELCYLQYTISRGSPIAEHLELPFYRYFKKAIPYMPGFFLLQVLPDLSILVIKLVVTENNHAIGYLLVASFLSSGICGLISLIIDVYMLYAFAKFTQFTRSRKEEEIDAHFVIISKYGIAASSLCLASFVLYILGCFLPNSDDFIAGTQGVFSILFLTLFQMKLALYHNDLNKDEIVQNRLENAIGKDQLSKIKERTLKRNATRGGASNSSIYIYNTQSLEHVESTLEQKSV